MILAAAVVLAAGAARAEEPVLNVYNWSDYIGKDTVSKFEAETGIKVRYDVYDSNEVLEAKLLAGHSGYDVVVPSSSPYLERMAKAKVFLKLDRSKLTNYGNLDAKILASAAVADPGNAFGVPYMWGTTGIGVGGGGQKLRIEIAVILEFLLVDRQIDAGLGLAREIG